MPTDIALQNKPPIQTNFIHLTGKCDRCSRFHLRCFEFGKLFSLGDEDEMKGYCTPVHFWLTSIEKDKGYHESAEVHAVLINKQMITVDRKSV